MAISKPCPPVCKGVLIFDEVKVAAKLHWNSRNDNFVGHTMTSQEMATLSETKMKSTVVPNPWRGAVYFIILWDVQTK